MPKPQKNITFEILSVTKNNRYLKVTRNSEGGFKTTPITLNSIKQLWNPEKANFNKNFIFLAGLRTAGIQADISDFLTLNGIDFPNISNELNNAFTFDKQTSTEIQHISKIVEVPDGDIPNGTKIDYVFDRTGTFADNLKQELEDLSNYELSKKEAKVPSKKVSLSEISELMKTIPGKAPKIKMVKEPKVKPVKAPKEVKVVKTPKSPKTEKSTVAKSPKVKKIVNKSPRNTSKSPKSKSSIVDTLKSITESNQTSDVKTYYNVTGLTKDFTGARKVSTLSSGAIILGTENGLQYAFFSYKPNKEIPEGAYIFLELLGYPNAKEYVKTLIPDKNDKVTSPKNKASPVKVSLPTSLSSSSLPLPLPIPMRASSPLMASLPKASSPLKSIGIPSLSGITPQFNAPPIFRAASPGKLPSLPTSNGFSGMKMPTFPGAK